MYLTRKIASLFLTLLFSLSLSIASFAQQATAVSQEEANRALHLLQNQKEIVYFCEPCGETLPRIYSIKTIDIKLINPPYISHPRAPGSQVNPPSSSNNPWSPSSGPNPWSPTSPQSQRAPGSHMPLDSSLSYGIFINGTHVDLASIYFKDGNLWRNTAIQANIEVFDVSPTIPDNFQ